LAFDFPAAPDAGHWIRLHWTAMACRFEVLLESEDARFVSVAREALDEADRIEAAFTVATFSSIESNAFDRGAGPAVDASESRPASAGSTLAKTTSPAAAAFDRPPACTAPPARWPTCSITWRRRRPSYGSIG
jgi:hypothetical protein